ncbi:hypothetical protein [Dyadobacter sp. 22481]|uniref:hypothetical protein n=1 Tax=Dyadobacter sp. 22481 TaxID=3453926 RepID=UPI003F834B62
MEQIKAGQVWEARNKTTHKIDEVMQENGSTPVRSQDQYWQLNGRYWSDAYQHQKDLILRIS